MGRLIKTFKALKGDVLREKLPASSSTDMPDRKIKLFTDGRLVMTSKRDNLMVRQHQQHDFFTVQKVFQAIQTSVVST